MTTTSTPRTTPTVTSPRVAVLAAGLFLVVTAVHLVAQLTGPEGLRVATQVVAMPLLALALLASTRAPRAHLVRWTAVGLGLSWLGDSAPKVAGEHSFLVMVGFFLLAQVAYVVAFWPRRTASLAHRGTRGWPFPLAAYLVVLGVFLAWCVPGAGALTVPVVLYGALLVAMAVLATGVHPLAALGGALFVLSDGLIALDAFTGWYELPWHGLAVMSTYLVAQGLLVAGALGAYRLADRP